MKKRILQTVHFFAATLLTIALSSCATLPSKENQMAQKKDRLLLTNQASSASSWETDQVIINYSASTTAGKITIQGDAQVKDSISHSFPGMDFLHVYIYFLDEKGTYLAEKEVRPTYQYFKVIPERMPFKLTLPLPEKTQALAFGYWGKLISVSTIGENNGDWEIYHNPFTMKKTMR